MRLPLHTLLLAGLLSAGLVPAAHAAPAAATAAEVSRLEAECARLRTELARANADVAALKSDRGVRNDYRLRQRMADAEALARKLTEAEAQLRARTGAAPGPRAPAPTFAPPSAQPGDGPVELEAKADLLSDQARRLSAEAEDLLRTAGQLRGRQTLRKRAFQLERDPFASMDGSKRTMVFGGSLRTNGGKNNNSEGSGSKGDVATDTRSGGAGGASGGGGSSGGSTPTTGGGNATPPSTTMGPGAAPAPAPMQPAVPPTQMPPPTGGKGAEFTAPPPQPTSALSSQLRTLLDPATLSEVQRLERTGKPITDPEALEKLAAALRQRAHSLDAQSKSLRAKARP